MLLMSAQVGQPAATAVSTKAVASAAPRGVHNAPLLAYINTKRQAAATFAEIEAVIKSILSMSR